MGQKSDPNPDHGYYLCVDSAGDEIVFDFELQPGDLASVLRWRLINRPYTAVVFLVGVICFMLGIMFAIEPNGMASGAAFLLAFGLVDLCSCPSPWPGSRSDANARLHTTDRVDGFD